MTTVLAFDTSAAHCAAALLCAEGIRAVRVESMAKGQAERLMPFLEELLRDHGLGWRDIGGIGVGTGPGNFTGIRIAVAAARGLALGLGVPAVGVPGFEAAAMDLPRPVTVLLPAPREQVYMATLHDDFQSDRQGEGVQGDGVQGDGVQGDGDPDGDLRGGRELADDLRPEASRRANSRVRDRQGESRQGENRQDENRQDGNPALDGGAPRLLARADLPPGLLVAPPCPPEAAVAAIARIAARRLAAGRPVPRPAPLYVRGPDAAPPRDAAPRLLP